MPKQLVDRIDTQTKLQGSSRSDFVRQAVRKQLALLERWDAITKEARNQYGGSPLSEVEVAELVSKHRNT